MVRQPGIKEYSTFKAFVDNEVATIAGRYRLDGGSGPNGRAFARFWHEGKRWRINADSQVAPLLRAARASRPFVESKTRKGRATLRIDRKLRDSDQIEVYMYED
jgi:hypothetical protein